MHWQYVCIHVHCFDSDKCKCEEKTNMTKTADHTHTLCRVTEFQIRWFHSVELYSGSCVCFSPPEGENKNNWFHCFHLLSDLLPFIIITSIPLSFSLSPSLFLSLFVLLINFITLIAPHCLWRKQLPSLPPPPLSRSHSSPSPSLALFLLAVSSN